MSSRCESPTVGLLRAAGLLDEATGKVRRVSVNNKAGSSSNPSSSFQYATESAEEEGEEAAPSPPVTNGKRKAPAKPRKAATKRAKTPTPVTSPPRQPRPKPGDYSPWWKRELEPVYAQAPHGAVGGGGVAAHAPTPLRSKPGKQPAHSWFSVKADDSLDPAKREAALKRLRLAIKVMVAKRYNQANGAPTDTPSESRMRRKRMAVIRQRGKNLVTEAHRKIALDMVRRWDTLILPPFSTHDMVKRPRGARRKLNSKVARSLMSWRHYEFSLHVKAVFLREGKELLSPDEKFTTMACGACGKLNVRHSNEEWTCRHCGVFHLRDPAASRCIFIKPFDQCNLPNRLAVDLKARGLIQPTTIPDAPSQGQMTGEQQ